jgi:hypothetical protein
MMGATLQGRLLFVLALNGRKAAKSEPAGLQLSPQQKQKPKKLAPEAHAGEIEGPD